MLLRHVLVTTSLEKNSIFVGAFLGPMLGPFRYNMNRFRLNIELDFKLLMSIVIGQTDR